MTALTFRKVKAGFYATDDGHYAVIVDGYEKTNHVGALGDYEGFTGGEWAAVYAANGGLREDHNVGENLDWRDRMKDAIEVCERHAT